MDLGFLRVSVLSSFLHTTEPALRLLISLFLGYPCAILHRFFFYGKNANIQHLFCIITGLAIGYFNYGTEMVHHLGATIFTYIVLITFGGTSISVVLIFVFNLGYLSFGYFYVGTEDYDINWTMPQCILVLRLIGLAFDVYDGCQPIDSLSAESKKVALTRMPTLLEVLGYSLFPASFLVGPQYAMRRYQDFIGGQFSDDPKSPPKSIGAGGRRCFLGVLYLILFQVLGIFVSDDYLLSEKFDNHNFFMKCILLGFWGKYTLSKYISCWLITEGACIMFGISYNGKDPNGSSNWNGLENVKLGILENATEFNHFILSFNINTNHWVAQYVYKRLKFLGNRYLSQAAALLFLAVWHGLHSGYFVCFGFEFIVMYFEKDVKPLFTRNEMAMRYLSLPPVSMLVQALLRMYTFVFMGWCLLPFALLTYARYWRVFSSLYYMGIIIFCLYPIIYRPILRYLLKPKKLVHQE